MHIDFGSLPDTARVWVYQANRLLTDVEVESISAGLQPVLKQWAAHGQPLLASAQVLANRFVVIGVDEGYNLPSGCSIDSSVRTMQQMGQLVGVDFLDRSVVVQQANGSVQTIAPSDLKRAVADGQITPDTWLFNTLVKTKAELLTNWQVRAGESWLKRYFKPVAR